VDVPPIASRRLDLVSMSPAFMGASLDGDLARAATLLAASLPPDWPSESAARTLRRRIHQLAADPSEQPWLLRAMLTREPPSADAAPPVHGTLRHVPPPRTLVGRIGFHAPPDARGALEIGYAVEPAQRRRGYATEAVGAMLAWAQREHAICHFVASISPTNVPSLAVVRKFGFVRTGAQWDDEDGEELVFELNL
jgi:RimJ/RimL family protein N-acetyltransferase